MRCARRFIACRSSPVHHITLIVSGVSFNREGALVVSGLIFPSLVTANLTFLPLLFFSGQLSKSLSRNSCNVRECLLRNVSFTNGESRMPPRTNVDNADVECRRLASIFSSGRT